MKAVGFLFPGQGAQSVGMGFGLYQDADIARSVFDRADQLLNFRLSKLCFEGPDSDLTRTVNAQVAIFVTSIAALHVLHSFYPQLKPAVACGLSLGEFTALVALEAISFEDGLRLVRRRGELMEEANRKNPGTMASIIGLSINECRVICKESGVVLANLNGHEQLVLSGSMEAIERACQLAQAKGAKRAVILKVGGAFHSPLMKDAEVGLREALREVKIGRPNGHFIPNVTGEIVSDLESIRTLLAQQLTSPVQWIRTIETVGRTGIGDLLEIGPGHVLKGLVRKINPKLNVYSIEQIRDLESLKPIALESTGASER